MLRLASMMATAALMLSADVAGVMHVRPPTQPVNFPPDESLPVLPDMSVARVGTSPAARDNDDAGQSTQKNAPAAVGQPANSKDSRLQPRSRLALVRFIDGEFVRVVQPIPAGKKGFHIKAGTTVDQNSLHMTLGYAGAAINPGDSAQITDLEFKDRQIILDINGGGRGKTRMRDRIHMEVGGMPTMTTTDQTSVNTHAGATVYLDFDKPLPDLTPDQLKQYLSSVLDFSRQHSAAVQWIDTLPPEIQTAIANKRPAVGMDHEMVLAALGRPDRKVREKEADGTETEDWIYGKPPAKTVFVTFEGDKVTQVEQFPQ